MYYTVKLQIPRAIKSVKAISKPSEPDQRAAITSDAEIELENKKQELEKALKAVTQASLKLNGLFESEIRSYSGQIARLSVEIARKILKIEIESGNYKIERVLHDALANIPARDSAVIRLNPADFATVIELQKENKFSDELKFTADPQVGKAECAIKTAQASLESHIEAHLQQIEQALLGAYE